MPGARAAAVQSVVGATSGCDGGLNIRDAVNQLAPNEVRKAENGVLDERGGFSKRLGCQSMGTFGVGTDRVLSMYTFYRGSSTAPQVLIHTSGGNLYYTNDPTANPIVWTLITGGLSGTAPMSFETFNSKCYFSNGVDAYASWDGAAYATYASAPKAKFLRLWKDTMWASGVTGLDDRLYSSAPGNAESWPVANWVDLGKGDGDAATALASDGLYLVFFKRQRHFSVYDPVTFANRVIDFEKGCESHFSVVQAEGRIYFLSRRGICQYYGDSPSEIISGKIDPLFDPNVINLDALKNVYAYTVGNAVGWAIPEVGFTYPTLQVEYYPRLGVLSPFGNRGIGPFVFHRMPAGVFTRWRYQSNERLFAGHASSNKVLYAFAPIGTDDGAAFAASLETGAFNFGSRTMTKYIRRIRILGRGRFIAQLKRNFQTSIYKTKQIDMIAGTDTWNPAETWGIGTWGPDSILKEYPWNADAYGRYFQLVFTDAETGTGLKPIPVGSTDKSLTAGEWAFYLADFDATILGVRD